MRCPLCDGDGASFCEFPTERRDGCVRVERIRQQVELAAARVEGAAATLSREHQVIHRRRIDRAVRRWLALGKAKGGVKTNGYSDLG